MTRRSPSDEASPGAVDLSVVIVSHNSSAVLPDCLRSVFATAGELRLEAFVVDNASTDDTLALVRRDFAQVIVIANEENRWFSAANNKAIRQARGRHVLCFNPDTVVGPNALREMVRFLDGHPRAGAVGVKLLNRDGSLQPSCRNFLTSRSLLIQHAVPWRLLPKRLAGRFVLEYGAHDRPRRVDWLIGACLAVRRETIDEIGLKDEAFPMFHEETDWCMRIRRAGFEVWFLPSAEVVHLGGTSTVERWGDAVVLEYYRAKLHFVRKHYGPAALLAHRVLISGLFALRLAREAAVAAISRLRGDPARADEARRLGALYRKALRIELDPRTPVQESASGSTRHGNPRSR